MSITIYLAAKIWVASLPLPVSPGEPTWRTG
jgi:hypothetical protein